MSNLSRRNFGLYVAALVAVVGFAATPALSDQKVLGGKWSKDDITSRCAAVGGVNIEGQGGKGYGCYNPSKGTMVACNEGGTCTGYTPPKS